MVNKQCIAQLSLSVNKGANHIELQTRGLKVPQLSDLKSRKGAFLTMYLALNLDNVTP